MKLAKNRIIAFLTVFMLVFSSFGPLIGHASNDVKTVEDAIANNQGTATVEGYIVAHTVSTKSYKFSPPFNNDFNIAIADHADETDPAKILPVQLPADFRADFGLQTNPDIIGEKVTITGKLESYFTVPGLKNPSAMTFTEGEPGDGNDDPFEGIEGLRIHDIQGEGHQSPYADQNVKAVQGVVTKVVDSRNFYMQELEPDDNPNTSEGVLIYKPTHNIRVGDKVEIDGTVKEWVLDGYAEKLETDLAMTEINAQNGNLRVLSSGNELPAPIILGKDVPIPSQVIDNDQFSIFDPEEDGIDLYESVEGMRVAVENPQVVAPQKYGEVPVIAGQVEGKTYSEQGGVLISEDNQNPERLHLLLDNTSFVAKTGDSFQGTVTGVMTYGYSNYKILTDMDTLPALNEREITPIKTELGNDDSKLTVASYNIENYFEGTSQDKTNKIALSMINELNTPDIIGLVEVQDDNGPTDNGTTTAERSYKKLIDAIASNGGPTYEWTDIAPLDKQDGGQPGGNIRVGYIYNPERVSLKDAPKGGATDKVSYENGSLTLNPGRIDPENPIFESTRKSLAAQFEFNGEDVVVIANHFNSKTGDQPLFGKNQPPYLGSEAKRIEISKVVNGFVSDIHAENPKANVVVLGDLNDFEFSKPLDALKGEELTNMVETLPENERYTYNYQGNAQVLDHILVSNHLAGQTEVDIVNINSLYMEQHGRASDHDPLLVELSLAAAEEENGPFSLSVLHTNDTHAHLENVPRLFTAVNQMRNEKENSLLLDAGDVFSGTLFFNQYLGQADLEFMNRLGYDAMTFGNHEFDKDSEVLAAFIEKAAFPFVSANVNVSNEPILNNLKDDQIGKPGEAGTIYPAIIKEIDGEKVGIFGLTTEDTSFLANPSENIVFEDAVQTSIQTVEALEAEGVNKIIALSHLGFNPDQRLAEEVRGIDVIVGGHSHTKLESPVVINEDEEPVLIVQANEYNNYLGTLDVTFDEEGVLTDWNGELIALLAKNENGEFVYGEDQWAKQRLTELSEPLEELKRQKVGYSDVPLNGERTDVRTKETNLGNMIADGMLEKANESVSTQIAMQNGGGIRASIAQGDITLGDVLTVMPFGNMLVTLDLTGEEILAALEHSVAQVENGAGQFMQVAGLRFKYDMAEPAGSRVHSVEVKINDKYETIDKARKYTVATNAFTADGGDGYDMFKQAKDDGRITELFEVDYDVFATYLEKNSPVSPEVEGRIMEASKSAPEEPGGNACKPGKDMDYHKCKEEIIDKVKDKIKEIIDKIKKWLRP
ncbi:5'-nucleotidase C-terminal domain-containing protein [Cytobacillus purgationiresistens]|uniref:2',3'-cyclic-nucleotide 2'-phosphodiesterase (5'-nucleotidase family)/predicted extracellular nuclease n=1 Tax=Cytobacillus purgationiresistens TaxID=863449 RepID=A0ABU0AFK5_9BACI|nr:5'-nucleotidase C-terminal domain-containing protein [Cytobacillus purgationiresistens]MDQ0270039.1 2',3'-cyclic-nucleotide 2'-phosphodiesterase (5'-nucleotidase family)/predicted extracellular nuclease [Cytobacillus purgationiresistens]